MLYIFKIALVAFVAVACAYAGDKDGTTLWDFSEDRSTSRLPTSIAEGRAGNGIFDYRCSIELRTNVGHARLKVESVSIQSKAGKVVSVSFRAPMQTAQVVEELILYLAKEFAVDAGPLTAWRKQAATDKDAKLLIGRHDTVPCIDLEVRTSFNEEKPWHASLTVTWLERDMLAPR